MTKNSRAAAGADSGIGSDLAGIQRRHRDLRQRKFQLFGRHQSHRGVRPRSLIQHRGGNGNLALTIDRNECVTLAPVGQPLSQGDAAAGVFSFGAAIARALNHTIQRLVTLDMRDNVADG